MLQAIREKAQGWIAWAIVILITIPFALWGIHEYMGGGGDDIVAEVEGQKISGRALEEQTRRLRENLRAGLGDAYRPELFSEDMLRRQALNQMLNEQVLRNTANNWGMRASDQMVVDAIAGERAFQVNGRFDHNLYQTVLRNNGLSEAAYEASIRQGLALEQLQAGVATSAFATRAEIENYQRLLQQKRSVAYAIVPADKFLSQANPDDAAVKAYFDSHQDRYRLPERVKLDYLLLDMSGMAESIEVTDADLAAYFDQHKDEFIAPEERELRHILIPIEGDEAAALAKANDLRAQLAAGADFAALAKANSADPGSASKGGDLGWVSRGIMVEPFEKAAFALAEGTISEPVKSPFGFHLIQVQGIRGGGEASLDQVREQVTAAYRKAEVERDFFERSERLAELAYENPDNLATAAEVLGLAIQHSDWITRAGGQGDLASPKVAVAAFSEDVLQQNHNSELLELGPERLMVLRVAEHQEARARNLDEVRDQVLQSVRLEQAAELARAAGEQALERLKGGAKLEALAAEQSWTFTGTKPVDRQQADVPAAVRDLAFRLPRPEGGSDQVTGTPLATGDYVLVALSKVEDGDTAALDAAGRDRLATRLAARSGRVQLGSMMQALRDKADVHILLNSGDKN